MEHAVKLKDHNPAAAGQTVGDWAMFLVRETMAKIWGTLWSYGFRCFFLGRKDYMDYGHFRREKMGKPRFDPFN